MCLEFWAGFQFEVGLHLALPANWEQPAPQQALTGQKVKVKNEAKSSP
jgi:hypothetical protein